MIRVLQVVNIMNRSGLETMLMNYYRNIDRNKIQFDFLTHRTEAGTYEQEIMDMGGRIYRAPRLYPQNYLLYFRYMKKFFSQHSEYKIVHSHIDAMSAFPLAAAKENNIPIRIAHSHTSKLDNDLKLPIKFIALKSIPAIANHYCACGNTAGNFMFHNKSFRLINNAIDLKKFQFNPEKRMEIKNKFGIKNELIIGHVGRFCYIKNQLFLLDIFKEILKQNPECKLILIGKGEDEQRIRKKIKHLKISEKVKLLLDRSDVNDIYQIFDIFVMPSLFEGLPVVAIEAQANGLPSIVSDRISKEVLLTSNIKMLSLDDNAEEWAKTILATQLDRNMLAEQQLQANCYNIKTEAIKLTDWYQELYRESSNPKRFLYENSNDRT